MRTVHTCIEQFVAVHVIVLKYAINIAIIFLLAVVATFYLTHWEKYITGVLYLPWLYDISQLVMVTFTVCNVCVILGYVQLCQCIVHSRAEKNANFRVGIETERIIE